IAETLVEECVNAPAIIRYIKENQKEPVVQLGSFKNRSDEHLDTEILATKFKVALINSGKVKFSAEKAVKEELREEILAQQDWASEETAKILANETGADFLLIGSVRTIIDSIPGETVRTYQVVAELYDIETSEIVWSGENMDIKKHLKQSSIRW
ncbi:MAG: penicillin-binding protein activator LpoB, partial [Spirochaetaceae bacterium]|nr:penicillin-binding protein activator LpoB [Spirochaetaceae bacterium]